MFQRLQDAGLALNQDKCVLGAEEVTFLGHRVSAAGLEPIPAKLESIRAMPQPPTKVALQRYLGCINFYHRFLPGIASVLAPLHALVASVSRPKGLLDWQSQHQKAFAESKERLASSVLLAHPDSSASVTLTTDASDVAVLSLIHI